MYVLFGAIITFPEGYDGILHVYILEVTSTQLEINRRKHYTHCVPLEQFRTKPLAVDPPLKLSRSRSTPPPPPPLIGVTG